MDSSERERVDFDRLVSEGSPVGVSILPRGSAEGRGVEERVLRAPLADVGGFWTWLAARDDLAPLRLVDLTAVDRLGRDPGAAGLAGARHARFEVVYSFQVEPTGQRFRVLADVGATESEDEAPGIESVTRHWPAANWLEREVFDLFGITFTGHPDLRRILLGSDFKGAPLRKDATQAASASEGLEEGSESGRG